jgi:hypothetical protein
MKRNIFMSLVDIVKGETLPNGRTVVISRSVYRPVKMLIPAENADKYIADQKAAGNKDVSLGKPVKDGKMVEVYITHGQINEHRYSVPSEKADEFISKQKKLAKKDLGIMLVTTAGLTALGTWGLNKLLKIKNKWI